MSHRCQCTLLLILMLLIGGLGLPHPAEAQTVSCANPTVSNVQFGTVDFTTGTLNVSGSIGWSCTSTGILGLLLSPQANIVMCLNLNTGTGGTQANPRLLSNGSNTLQYQLYANATHSQIWGSTATSATPIPISISVAIPAGLILSTTITGQTPFYAQLPGGQTTAPVGTYNSTLSATVNGSYNTNTSTPPSSCTSGPNALNPGSAAFVASATVQKACVVTANNVNLGAVPSTAVNTTASNTLSVTCTNGTPFFVGLAPSNGNTAGAGVMKGTRSGNTDQVPYQLSSTPGPGGTPWGNTATSTTAGNGKAGSGSGLAQSLTVYATAPSANYTPDSYSDTVTVNVNY
ncbi:Spore coat protein U [Paraburkholderia ribeironis]|uniref:Spore coat protein U n=1 Tax=Paraburkholderia ribeironis TaxID=1247936 RepID=A0A1N7S8P3_9BURK|nr:spore coat protein U domain-containing protein [Paraburkholderia ribeironis]SIT43691.1 Spore coat protein U [Paraburkholderia ribeironis]